MLKKCICSDINGVCRSKKWEGVSALTLRANSPSNNSHVSVVRNITEGVRKSEEISVRDKSVQALGRLYVCNLILRLTQKPVTQSVSGSFPCYSFYLHSKLLLCMCGCSSTVDLPVPRCRHR